ncbi:MAG: DUF2497 domain-containing protein [Henriciella sp.]|uniref:DUF2497 domain-containing protein n=1 Tax=Henriciella sp. TaxID=1968823 RepID=UPI003C717A62
MADKAQAEPTMEEILASIRKIIADDGEPAQAAGQPTAQKEPQVSVAVSDEDGFDDLSLDDVIAESDGDVEALSQPGDDDFDTIGDDDEGGELLTDVDEEMFEELTADKVEEEPLTAPAPEDELEDFDFEAVDLDADEPMVEDSLATIEPEWDVVEEAEPAAPAPQPEPAAAQHVEEPVRKETSMLRGKTETAPETSPEPASSGLTDERIAGAAASALGKLMVKQSTDDDGNPNTLDGLMRELLRPMIKEWLDANLPGIVERKVEEEVQRIARMAR